MKRDNFLDEATEIEDSADALNNSGERLALRTIVLALVAHMALDHERNGRGQAQAFVNSLAETCANSIDGAQSNSWSKERMDAVRERARENLNKLLGSIELPKVRGGN